MWVSREEYEDLKNKEAELYARKERIIFDDSRVMSSLNEVCKENFNLKGDLAEIRDQYERQCKTTKEYKDRWRKKCSDYKHLESCNARLRQLMKNERDRLNKREATLKSDVARSYDEADRLSKNNTYLRSELRKEKELNRQLTEEVNSRVKFVCKPMAKELEEIRDDYKTFLDAVLIWSDLGINDNSCYSRKYIFNMFKDCATTTIKRWFEDEEPAHE